MRRGQRDRPRRALDQRLKHPISARDEDRDNYNLVSLVVGSCGNVLSGRSAFGGVTEPPDRIERDARAGSCSGGIRPRAALSTVEAWPIVGDGGAGPPWASIWIDHASA